MILKRKPIKKEDIKEIAWKGARIVENHDPNTERLDACGAWIHYDDFENYESDFGWDIDHVYPLSKLRLLKVSRNLWNDVTNIRAMNWKNNQSKGNAYPTYTTKVQSKGDINIESEKTFYVEESLQYSLRCLFKLK